MLVSGRALVLSKSCAQCSCRPASPMTFSIVVTSRMTCQCTVILSLPWTVRLTLPSPCCMTLPYPCNSLFTGHCLGQVQLFELNRNLENVSRRFMCSGICCTSRAEINVLSNAYVNHSFTVRLFSGCANFDECPTFSLLQFCSNSVSNNGDF